MLTAQRLRELLNYDPGTGIFTALKGRPKLRVGAIAGTKREDGYIWIKIDYAQYGAHRLAWFYMTGTWPAAELDHWDRNRSNNAWANLRPATDKQQAENRKIYITCTSGIRGVRFESGKWRARIGHAGRYLHVGFFRTKEEAIAARLVAERTLFTHAPSQGPGD